MRHTCWAIIAIAIGAVSWNFTPIWETFSTCAYCRLGKTELWAFDVRVWSTLHENKCSRWYSTHVERAHNHMWVFKTHGAAKNLFGVTRTMANFGSRPINAISPEAQRRVYEKFEDPRDAKRLFEDLGRKYGNTLEGEYGYVTASIKADVIRDWERAGFPGTWDERWSRYREENRKFMSWLESLRRGLDNLEGEARP